MSNGSEMRPLAAESGQGRGRARRFSAASGGLGGLGGTPRVLTLVVLLFLGGGAPNLLARTGAVATVHPLATQAGLDALARGGNAVDAAVAAALMLGVVDGHNSGIGGGCLALVRLGNGTFVGLDGRETAPAAATRDMFLRDRSAVPDLSLVGPLAVGVPGELALLDRLARRYGRLPLREPLLAAARIADEGFPLTESFANRLRAEVDAIRRFPATAAIFLNPDGSPRPTGDVLRQPDLARTYRAIADHGTRWFYRGPFADQAAEWMARNDGLLTRDDFRRYRVRVREPIRTRYRDCEIIGFPPPSSGGVHVAQILQILESFDLPRFGSASADFAHTVAEASKRAFADRAHWLGDSDFALVPRGLLDPSYAARLAEGLRPDRATDPGGPGVPPDAWIRVFGRHTTHLCAADGEGNWVALTATVNTTLGSKVVVPGTGVVLNNQMDDFAVQPGVPNFFGLTGSEVNAVAAGKRPLSSMSPTIVLRDGRPILAVGAAGGPTIISQAVLTILQVVDFGRSPTEAGRQPRLHHQWRPDELVLERGWAEDVLADLRRRGHRVREVPALGATQAVGWFGGRWDAAADERVGGSGRVLEEAP